LLVRNNHVNCLIDQLIVVAYIFNLDLISAIFLLQEFILLTYGKILINGIQTITDCAKLDHQVLSFKGAMLFFLEVLKDQLRLAYTAGNLAPLDIAILHRQLIVNYLLLNSNSLEHLKFQVLKTKFTHFLNFDYVLFRGGPGVNYLLLLFGVSLSYFLLSHVML